MGSYSRLFIKSFLRLKLYFKQEEGIEKRIIDEVIVIYRISDVGYPKNKPIFINNENCLKNAIRTFPLEKCKWYVIADNISEETYQMINQYLPEKSIISVSVGNGAGTFRLAYEIALKSKDTALIYFLENDYLHKPEALNILLDAVQCNIADYYTLYDHPDKYGITQNPLVKHGGESTRVLLTSYSHWKYTNSTTMTFASMVHTLKKDKKVFWEWTNTSHPFDFQIFIELNLLHKRHLASPLPSLSTHGESAFLSPLVDWSKLCDCNEK